MRPPELPFTNRPGIEQAAPKASRLITLLVVLPWAVAAALIVRYL